MATDDGGKYDDIKLFDAAVRNGGSNSRTAKLELLAWLSEELTEGMRAAVDSSDEQFADALLDMMGLVLMWLASRPVGEIVRFRASYLRAQSERSRSIDVPHCEALFEACSVLEERGGLDETLMTALARKSAKRKV